jgi:hypothetical protein
VLLGAVGLLALIVVGASNKAPEEAAVPVAPAAPATPAEAAAAPEQQPPASS